MQNQVELKIEDSEEKKKIYVELIEPLLVKVESNSRLDAQKLIAALFTYVEKMKVPLRLWLGLIDKSYTLLNNLADNSLIAKDFCENILGLTLVFAKESEDAAVWNDDFYKFLSYQNDNFSLLNSTQREEQQKYLKKIELRTLKDLNFNVEIDLNHLQNIAKSIPIEPILFLDKKWQLHHYVQYLQAIALLDEDSLSKIEIDPLTDINGQLGVYGKIISEKEDQSKIKQLLAEFNEQFMKIVQSSKLNTEDYEKQKIACLQTLDAINKLVKKNDLQLGHLKTLVFFLLFDLLSPKASKLNSSEPFIKILDEEFEKNNEVLVYYAYYKQSKIFPQSDLITAIEQLKPNSKDLPSSKAIIIEKLSYQLLKQALTLLESSKDPQCNPENSNQLKMTFIKTLHSKDTELQEHRMIIKPILTNILIALTGIGLLAIAAKTVFYGVRDKKLHFNNCLFFAETKSQQTFDPLAESIEKILIHL